MSAKSCPHCASYLVSSNPRNDQCANCGKKVSAPLTATAAVFPARAGSWQAVREWLFTPSSIFYFLFFLVTLGMLIVMVLAGDARGIRSVVKLTGLAVGSGLITLVCALYNALSGKGEG